ncbi:hypothetical protein [uncultured Tateyamaria sp.]|uniref:hypothetical protein n=1 Tax=uncultured Tateyamaria sp. TaxID=455651 RepID=UPI0026054341|nr:hypothetical protein [uncultured Tateyamaria sp.]
MGKRWHIQRDGASVTLCRHLPPRFDFVVRTDLPDGRAVRLAHQIRQDLWRALQRLRGFSPVVRLERVANGWRVLAGGRVTGPVPAAVTSRAQAVLDDPKNRARWVRSAGGAP